eukprot:gene29745-37090_t
MQYRMLMLSVFSNACNSLDVFMVSIIAALMELGLFAKFLLDGSCDELNRILKQYFRYNFSSESDAVCYQVSASLLAGAYILMVCVLFYITITQLCLYIFKYGAFILVLVGCLTESFQFDNKGVVGLLLGDAASSKYSFVSMGLAIPKSSWAEFGRKALGVRFLQFCFFLTSLVLPLLVIVQLIVLWLVPLSAQMQYRMLMLSV